MTADAQSPSAPTRESVGADGPDSKDPVERYGWLLAAVWLVFLVYPVMAAIGADRPVWARAVTVGIILAFAATYLRSMTGFESGMESDEWFSVLGRQAWLWMGALLGWVALTIPVLGLDALGLVPFVISFAAATLPLRQGVIVLGLAMMAAVVLPLIFGNVLDWLFFLIIYPMVGGFIMLLRVLQGATEQRRSGARMLEIAEERDRVARDVHDVLGHSLTVITVKTELAERLIEVDPQRAKAEMAEVRSISRQSLAEIRATVAGLRVARLADEVESARSALEGAGITLRVVGEPSEVDPRHRITAAWALRECVTNVVRHSRARTCEVHLRPDGTAVRDDGRGLRGASEGNGLRGLRERVAQAGGEVRVTDLHPGTEVVVQW